MKYPFKAMKYSRKYYDMSLNALVPKVYYLYIYINIES